MPQVLVCLSNWYLLPNVHCEDTASGKTLDFRGHDTQTMAYDFSVLAAAFSCVPRFGFGIATGGTIYAPS